MPTNLTEEQKADYRDAFSLFDKDGDGTITAAELTKVMESLGKDATPMEIQDMIDNADVNCDGKIEFEEFVRMMADDSSSVDHEKEMLEAFKVFDKDGSGTISHAELKQVMEDLGENMTEQEIDNMIKDADTDDDGMVNYQEFLAMMIV